MSYVADQGAIFTCMRAGVVQYLGDGEAFKQVFLAGIQQVLGAALTTLVGGVPATITPQSISAGDRIHTMSVTGGVVARGSAFVLMDDTQPGCLQTLLT